MEESIILSMKKYLGKLRRDPNQKVHAPLAEAYRRSLLLEDGEETAAEGLEQFPSYLLCREVLGKIYFRKGKLQEARQQLERVAKIVKNNPELSRILGKLYMNLGMLDEAKEQLNFVWEKDPFDFEVRNLLVSIERQQKQKDAPVAQAGTDPLDIFNAKADESSTDIESIIAGMDDPEIKDRGTYMKATDVALDALDAVEGTIDKAADEIYERNIDADLEEARRRRQERAERPEVYQDKGKEIQAAAYIGQVELEIHMLDEALLLANRLLKSHPEDEELQEIVEKFNKALEVKEDEMDKIEQSSLAKGL